jgi:hypothetical protein
MGGTVNPDAKLVMYWFTVGILIAPFAFWASLHIAVSIGYTLTMDTLYLIRILRWSVSASALLLVVLYFAGSLRLDAWPLAAALGASSVGLALPQAWVTARVIRNPSANP